MAEKEEKAVLIAISPKELLKIVNGDKTIEVRLSAPKREFPIDVYVYCSKGKEDMSDYGAWWLSWHRKSKNLPPLEEYAIQGKIVARFVLLKTEKFADGTRPMSDYKRILDKVCMSVEQAVAYRKGKPLFAWYIDEFEILEKPIELPDLKGRRVCDKYHPKSWKYIEVE